MTTNDTKFMIPESQGALIRWARGEKSQSVFALEIGVNRSCLSRYEAEKLGAPAKVINHCLGKLAEAMRKLPNESVSLKGSLSQARLLVAALEDAIGRGY